MRAAIVLGPNETPVYAEAAEPVTKAGEVQVTVRAAALTHLTKGRASGGHYSSEGVYPAVVGVDGVGVTEDGRRVYFALPDAPNGAMGERTAVAAAHCIDVPPGIDDVMAAAVANPGMSAWAALVERARLVRGETVLVNGATGVSGRLAVQLAKYLGAARVIVSGRSAAALEELRALGADVVIPFDLQAEGTGAKKFESALKREFAIGVDVIVDYLWGKSAETIIVAVAKAVEDGRAVRFVQVGSMTGGEITLPAAALRSSSLVMMGSGLKSVALERLLVGIGKVFEAFVEGALKIEATAVPLAQVTDRWADEGRVRVVFLP